MLRLLWLALGLALAIYGFHAIAAGESLAGWQLRDGLLVATLGALLFTWRALPLAHAPQPGGIRQWPAAGRTLVGTALACGLAAAGILTFWGTDGWFGWLGISLWGVGALALLVGLLWPGRIEIYPAPAYRWRVDAAGNWVRMALDAPEQPVDAPHNSPFWHNPLYPILLFGLLGVGVALRVWQLGSLPATCVDTECDLALQLLEGGGALGLITRITTGIASLYHWLSLLLYRISGDAILSLRGASALLGCLALPAIYWAARAYARPAGALLGLLFLALLPWVIWTSRLGSAWNIAPLLVALVVGLGTRALSRRDPRWWGATGIALGLLWAQPLGLEVATLLWLVALTLLAGWRGGGVAHAGVLLASAIPVGLPMALPALRNSWLEGMPPGDALLLLAGLLHSNGAALEYFVRQPLLPPLLAGLAWVGLGTWLRWAMQPRVLLALSGATVYLGALLWATPPVTADAIWLILLPFGLLAAAVAADQLVVIFDRAWNILIPLPRALIVVTALLVVLVGRQALNLTQQLDLAGSGAQSPTAVAMGQYLARCLRGEGESLAQIAPRGFEGVTLQGTVNQGIINGNEQAALCRGPSNGQGDEPAGNAPIFYVPPAVLSHSATRLLLGSLLDAGQIRPFDPTRDLLPFTPPAGESAGDIVYLVALENQPIIELLQQLYPNAQLRGQPQEQAGPTLFLTVQVARADILARQGALGRYYAGTEAMGEPVTTRQEGPLRFAWASEPPLAAPFNAVWEASLLVPTAGVYGFAVAGATGQEGPVISLQLDGNLVLDTSLGRIAAEMPLAQGAYHLTLRYRTASTSSAPGRVAPGDWAITWTPPGGSTEPIPRAALYSPPLPNMGLVGSYYAGTAGQGAPLSVRKDLVLGAPVDLPQPYSVRWTGKLAAARAGEYIFAVTANGPVALTLDGRDVLAHLPPSELAEGPPYTQASIYLDVGWHALVLDYAPGGTSDLQMLWQPPGSSPTLLAARYLLPTLNPDVEVTVADVPLPAPPPLFDPRLGDERFALTANLQLDQPSRTLPPTGLPLLLAERGWRVANGCGAGDDQLDSPRGLVVDDVAQRVYVADAGNRRVVELDLIDGAFVQSFALPEFQEPVDVALDSQGALLVLDATAQIIMRIDRATGEAAPLALGTSFYRPRGLAVDNLGNILVADTGGARIALLDATGNSLTQYGGVNTTLGLGQPTDVLALGTTYWAVTGEHGRLWQLDSLGSLVALERANTLTGPQMAALSNGGIFLSDPARRTVLYLAPNGQPLAQLGYQDEFLNPMGVGTGWRNDLVDLVVSDPAACSVALWRVRPE